jgi:hypothetical protein
MNKDNLDLDDDIQAEYDLTQLQIRRLGSGRTTFAGIIVSLERDVRVSTALGDVDNSISPSPGQTAEILPG